MRAVTLRMDRARGTPGTPTAEQELAAVQAVSDAARDFIANIAVDPDRSVPPAVTWMVELVERGRAIAADAVRKLRAEIDERGQRAARQPQGEAAE